MDFSFRLQTLMEIHSFTTLVTNCWKGFHKFRFRHQTQIKLYQSVVTGSDSVQSEV